MSGKEKKNPLILISYLFHYRHPQTAIFSFRSCYEEMNAIFLFFFLFVNITEVHTKEKSASS